MIQRSTCFLFLVFLASSAFAQDDYARGLVWDDARYVSLPLRYSSTAVLPGAKSLKAYYPKVVIQPPGDMTGPAWATVWSARTAADALACGENNPQKVLQMAYSPSYNYGLLRKGQDCQDPVNLIDLLESLVKNGGVYFSEFREFCPTEVPADLYPIARLKKLGGYSKLFNPSDDQVMKIHSVKGAIASNQAVIGGLICPPSFHLAQDSWQPREPAPDRSYGGHAVCIVGYDDTKFGGAFEVLNSWGKGWGVQGYSWIRYKDFAEYFPYAFSLFQPGTSSCRVNFEASINFRLLSGQEMPVTLESTAGHYKFTTPYPTGTTFSIHASTNLPAYIYLFGVDPGGIMFPLFPRSPSTIPISFTSLKAPDDMGAITLTDPPGRNQVFAIVSPEAIDLGKLLDRLKNKKDLTAALVQVELSASTMQPRFSERTIGLSGNLLAPVAIKVTLEQTKK